MASVRPSLMIAAALTLAGCSGGGAASPAAAGVVEVNAKEYAFDPSTLTVKAGEVTFRVKNTGVVEHEFEIFKGEAVVDEVEGLVPGLSQDLKVTLAAGDYTYVCKLEGHEEQGMKGTLKVN